MNVTTVVYTGGPCAGKSTILPIAKQWLEDRGCQVALLAETATELISGGLHPRLEWEHPATFQRELLQYQLMREMRYIGMLERLPTTSPKVLLCDRGALDGVAYMGEEAFADMARTLGMSLHSLLHRYDLVVHLRTAARGAEEHYTLANNLARSESATDAARADHLTEQAWLGHPHFTVIDNRTAFTDKIRRALHALARKLPIPEPKEVERKFLVYAFQWPDNAATIQIEQTYLTSDADVERRVRARTVAGVTSFYYTEKRPTPVLGVRIERERMIFEEEYLALLSERDPRYVTIKKTRMSFVHEGQHLELDLYHEPYLAFGILEIELDAIDQPVDIPAGWDVHEVTGDKTYSNKQLAQKMALVR